MRELAEGLGYVVLVYLSFAVPIWIAVLLWVKPWRNAPTLDERSKSHE